MPLDIDDDVDTDTQPTHRDLKAEAKSRAHLLVHEPKNPHCPACRISSMQHKPARRHSNVVRPKKFGDKITADHVYAHSEQMGGVGGDMDVFVVYDLGTDWLGVYPVGSKKVAETKPALVHFGC